MKSELRGNFFLFILVSTGELNTKWLSCADIVAKPPLSHMVNQLNTIFTYVEIK